MGLKSVPLLALLASIIPPASMLFSRRAPVETLPKGDNEEALTDRLYPFLDDSRSSPNYSDLWDAMGGIRGLLRMNRESIIAMGVAKGLRKSDPDSTGRPAREMFWTALCLWVITAVSLAEAFSAGKNQSRPRAASLWSAKLYCDMRAVWGSLKEFRDRSSHV